MKRTYDEFKAEVFSRSDKIIAKRKRAKRIVMCCVPLVLCAAVITMAYFSGNGFNVKNEADGALNGIFDEENRSDAFVPEASVGSTSDNSIAEDGSETTSAETVLPVPVAVTVSNCKNGTTSYERNSQKAALVVRVIEKAMAQAPEEEIKSPAEYNVTISYSDNTNESFGISEGAIRYKDTVYIISSADYDSILSAIGGIIS